MPAWQPEVKQAERVDGIVVLRLGLFVHLRGDMTARAREAGLPTLFGHRIEVAAGGLTIVVPADLDAYREELTRHFPGDRDGISKLLGLMQRLFTEIRSVTMREIHETGVSPELQACRDLTWREFALRFVTEETQDALAERSCFLGLPPSRVSALSMVAMLMNYFDGGAWRIRGGYQKLANLLAEDIQARGSTVRLATPVREILVRDGRAVGVLLEDGEEVRAGYVISNGDPRRTLPNSEPGTLRPSLSFLVVHLGLSSSVQDLFRASSIGYYPGGSVERTYRYEPGRIQEEDLFIGFGLPTVTDDSLAPPGKHIMSIHHPLPADQFEDWKLHREAIADRLVTRLEAVIPDLRTSIEHRSIATPQTFERYTWNGQGVAYGWEQTPDRWSALAKLQTRLPARLFQVGHWADYGGGTVSAIASGHEVARQILNPTRGLQHVGR